MPKDAYRDGQLINPQAVGQALKETLKTQFKPHTRHASVALGGQAALVRRIHLPKLTPQRLRELIENQGDQWIPFLREGAAFDFTVVDPNVSDHEQEVLLAAVPTRYIDNLSLALKLAGLKLAALDIDTTAHYRAALASRSVPADATVAILDLEQERARLGLFHRGSLAVVRSLDTYAYLPEDGDTLDPIMLEGFVVDVRRAVEIMLSQVRGEVTLAGLAVVSAQEPPQEMFAMLEQELQAEMGQRLTDEFHVRPAGSTGIPGAAALGFGLSLAEAGLPRVMNLLPQAGTAERRQRRVTLAVSSLLVLGTAAYAFLWSQEMPQLHQKRANLEQTLARDEQFLQREPEIAAEEAMANAIRPLIDQLNQTELWSVAGPRLKELLPGGVVIESLNVSPPDIGMTGNAPDAETLAEFLQALEDSPHFTSPVMPNMCECEGRVNFSVSITMASREVPKQ